MAPDLPYTTVGILLVTCTRGQNSSGGLMIIRRAVLAKVHGAYTFIYYSTGRSMTTQESACSSYMRPLLVAAGQLLKVSHCERSGQLLCILFCFGLTPSSALPGAAVASPQGHRCDKVAAWQLLRSIA